MAPVFSKVVRSIPRLPLPRRSSSGSKERERVGRRKALLIGINYQWGEAHEYFQPLQGSIRDVQGLKDVLIRELLVKTYYRTQEIADRLTWYSGPVKVIADSKRRI